MSKAKYYVLASSGDEKTVEVVAEARTIDEAEAAAHELVEDKAAEYFDIVRLVRSFRVDEHLSQYTIKRIGNISFE